MGALVTSAHTMLVPHIFVMQQALGLLAPDRCCKTFNANANGFTRGEGAGAVMLSMSETS